MQLDGSTPVQLTHSTDESVFVVSWFPKDDRILYTADKDGDELDHLYVRELSGDEKNLTPGADLKPTLLLGMKATNSFCRLQRKSP
jgi:Tol biopolymer transport system component